MISARAATSVAAKVGCWGFLLLFPSLGLAADDGQGTSVPATVGARLVEDYLARRPSMAVSADVTAAEAAKIQEEFVSQLSGTLGKPIGYKVGLVTKEAQEKSGVSSPIHGVLLEQMLLPNNAEVSVNYGVKPLLEADLVVTVRDRAINNAAVPLDVLRNLKEIVAFIELPDSLIATNLKVTGPLLSAANVGARLGILGERVPVKVTPAFVTALEEMTIAITDGAGQEHGKATGSVILGNPLHAVLWLIDDLRKRGKELKVGDLISLGSVRAVTPQPGQTYTVKYDGLPGGPISVSVKMK